MLSFLLIGAGLAGLFVSPRRWPHALGLIAVPALYVGGVVFGLGLMITYDIDPGLSGRYALSLGAAARARAGGLVTGRWAQRALRGALRRRVLRDHLHRHGQRDSASRMNW